MQRRLETVTWLIIITMMMMTAGRTGYVKPAKRKRKNRERKSIEGGVVGLRPNQTWKSI